VLQAFDELLLLRRGGDTVFQGKIGVDSSDLIQYFSSIRWDSQSASSIELVERRLFIAGMCDRRLGHWYLNCNS
jgi:hypothetical protein